MALLGFGLSTEQDKNKKPKSKTEPSKETASASVLLISKKPKKTVCIFCKSSHESFACEKALPLIFIGADVAGKLLTGRKHNLKNELTAFETHLGWTVMEKLPKALPRPDTATLVTTLCVQEASPSDLWRLDVIRITDPIEKASKLVRDEQTREFLKRTAKLNPDSRYEVMWIEDHAPVSSNYDIARNRLKICIERLKTQNLFEAYDNVFKEWLSEGVIEKVPGEGSVLGHYLPHRPVVKTHGTTKIRPSGVILPEFNKKKGTARWEQFFLWNRSQMIGRK
ncbi:hypothetical protein ALC62_13304 [Cyphomyrmex costatus]|uniref:Uncharacterized protein n=1 Tax=Cyphomyrmex costatus TaxID=456900 RepID=A0A151IAB6_9HYME|nr:hypothetical protein ALC62_13304 [Cyphomyrmex costatus]